MGKARKMAARRASAAVGTLREMRRVKRQGLLSAPSKAQSLLGVVPENGSLKWDGTVVFEYNTHHTRVLEYLRIKKNNIFNTNARTHRYDELRALLENAENIEKKREEKKRKKAQSTWMFECYVKSLHSHEFKCEVLRKQKFMSQEND